MKKSIIISLIIIFLVIATICAALCSSYYSYKSLKINNGVILRSSSPEMELICDEDNYGNSATTVFGYCIINGEKKHIAIGTIEKEIGFKSNEPGEYFHTCFAVGEMYYNKNDNTLTVKNIEYYNDFLRFGTDTLVFSVEYPPQESLDD